MIASQIRYSDVRKVCIGDVWSIDCRKYRKQMTRPPSQTDISFINGCHDNKKLKPTKVPRLHVNEKYLYIYWKKLVCSWNKFTGSEQLNWIQRFTEIMYITTLAPTCLMFFFLDTYLCNWRWQNSVLNDRTTQFDCIFWRSRPLYYIKHNITKHIFK